MSAPVTPAIERAGDAFTEAYQRAVREAPSNRQGITREDGRKCYQAGIRAGLAAALPTECHEAVVPEWADGEEMPCNSTRVVGFRSDDEGLYPVCAEHVREPMISLRTALLGADS